jgi:hypothetical protein
VFLITVILGFGMGHTLSTYTSSRTASSYNLISSSNVKGELSSARLNNYITESEQPHSSSVIERPTMGEVSLLAMPVYFPDMGSLMTDSQIEARWDVDVTDYYLENSYGLLSIDSFVTPWIEAPKSISYYADDAYTSTREMELAQFLLDYWNPVINFNDYNYVYIIYPGIDQQDDVHFWPHVWTWISGSLAAGDERNSNFKLIMY